MPSGLSVNGVYNVTVNLAASATAVRNFGAYAFGGPTDSIDVGELIRAYSNFEGVQQDFSVGDPEYQAAQLYFSQVPRPALLYIARWAKTATSGVIKGGTLTPAQQQLSNFTAITNGSLTVTVGGTVRNLTGINFSTATSMAQVAALVTSSSTGTLGGPVTWDGPRSRFLIKSAATGSAQIMGLATTPGAGVDVGPLLRFTAATGATTVTGIGAQTPLAFVQSMVNAESDWYGIQIVDSTPLTNNDYLQIAGYLEALDYSRIQGITTQLSTALDPSVTTDLPSVMKSAGYTRTMMMYSSTSAYAISSIMGRFATVDYSSGNSIITGKFKQAPGLVPEKLTKTQADALNTKNTNVYVSYQSGDAIIQEGEMSAILYIDERIGVDWLQNAIQSAGFTLMRTSNRVAQDEGGVTQLINNIEAVLDQAVTNGLIGAGTWTGPAIGQVQTGAALPKGYYVFSQSIASQSQADREARKAPPITVLVKLRGAVHFVNVAITVNR